MTAPATPTASANPGVDPEAQDTLRRSPIFAPLGRERLARIAAQSSVRTLRRGERLWRLGDGSDCLAVVIRGRMKSWIGDADSRGWVREVIRAGGVCGLPAALDGDPQICTLEALETSRVLCVELDEVRRQLTEDPQFALYVGRVVTGDLRRAVARCEQLANRSPLERLALYVLEQADSSGTLRMRETQGQIAAQIGTVREVVGRAFRRLESDGLLSRAGREVRILRRDALAQLARTPPLPRAR